MKPVVATLLLLVAVAAPSRAGELQTVSKDFPVGDARAVDVDFPAGNLIITAGDDDDVVSVTMMARCRFDFGRCAERVRNLRLVSDTRDGKLVFKLEGMRKMRGRGLSVTLRMTVPRSMPLSIDMDAGDLRVRGLEDDVDVHLGAGDADLRLPRRNVGAVQIAVGVGDASLRRGHDHWDGSGFLSKHLRWREGTGAARVEVDLGVGDVDVSLD